jgi:hypothetical protein
MSFDPSQTFDVVSPGQSQGFDPSQPHDIVSDETSYDDPNEGLLDAYIAPAASGTVRGLTFGGADELYGAGSTGYQTLKDIYETGEVTPMDKILERYRQSQQDYSQKADEIEARNPIISGASQLVGGVVGGLAGLGLAPAATMGRAALALGTEGAVGSMLSSDSNILGAGSEEIKQNLRDTGTGAVVGVTLGVAGKALMGTKPVKNVVSNIEKWLEEVSPTYSELKLSRSLSSGDYDNTGNKYILKPDNNSELLTKKVISPDGEVTSVPSPIRSAGELVDRGVEASTDKIVGMDKKITSSMNDLITSADKAGIKIPIKDTLEGKFLSTEDLEQYGSNGISKLSDDLDFIDSLKLKNMREPVYTGTKEAPVLNQKFIDKLQSPLESRKILTELDKVIYNELSMDNKNFEKIDKLIGISKKIRSSFKEVIPGYKDASNALSSFRPDIAETALTGSGLSPEYKNIRYSSMSPQEKNSALAGSMKNIVKGFNSSGSKLEPVSALTNLSRNESALIGVGDTLINSSTSMPEESANIIKQLGQSLKEYQVSPDINKTAKIQSLIDQANSAPGLDSVNRGIIGTISKAMLGITPKGIALNIANQTPLNYGFIGKTSNYVTNLHKIPDNQMRKFATKLEGMPGVGAVAKRLGKSLDNGDSSGKAAALFVLSQTEDGRKALQALTPEFLMPGQEE